MENKGSRRPNIIKKLFNLVLNRDPAPNVLAGSSRKFKRHYEMLDVVLGRGAFGTTYICQERKTGVKYACKTVPKDSTSVEFLRQEIRILKSLLSHPNIVSLKEAFEDKTNVYIVMEFCEGGELFKQIKRAYFYEIEAKGVIKSLVNTIQWCHTHGVIHRDIKPQNLILTTDNTLKLLDFGFATTFKPGQRLHDLKGTRQFMAPEVFLRDYGPEADIWSVGVVMYHMLCGRLPFSLSGNRERAKQMIAGAEVDFSLHPWPRVSREAKDLIKGMLQPDVEKRLTAHQILSHPWWLRNDLPFLRLRNGVDHLHRAD